MTAQTATSFVQVHLFGPEGSSDRFGRDVTVLADGSYVVTDPGFDIGATTVVGARLRLTTNG